MSLYSLSDILDYFEDNSMSRRRGTKNNDINYSKLPTSDQGFTDAQFLVPAQQIPWRAIVLATLLLVVGTSLLVFGCMVATGHIVVQYANRMWPMIILGTLMFIPGAYHVRIAYYAYKKVPGYSFDDIPEFE
ncbi:transmembrane protein 230-like isoform X1 [Diorhabda carinulata]|uniref:transmembrane protein 230-like isoform X1 n=1 Tax=Diorhabda sublineata TaxID=1163346 RepID=UPI0024E0F4F5|nr:transmembrane protein 230-like isoform X1 [Diorhabda sublineata]XP_057663946.1 transmembrane protein 230-like isoform X1 [Diorhabda carinulata]